MVEVLIVLAVLAGLAALLLPALAKSGRDRRTINCVSNLKQVGFGLRIWSNEHGNRFPWLVSTNDGGTAEHANTPDVFRHFLVLSNGLGSPKVLTCNSDAERTKASTWESLTNSSGHISYFVAVDADESRPKMFLTGERSLLTNGRVASGVISITDGTVLRTAPMLHTKAIVVGLADGSARILRGRDLQRLNSDQFASITNKFLRLAIP